MRIQFQKLKQRKILCFLSNWSEHFVAGLIFINGLIGISTFLISQQEHPFLYKFLNKNPWLSCAILFFVFLFSIMKINGKKTITSLIRDVEKKERIISLYKENMANLSEARLIDLTKKLGLSNSERLTIYIHSAGTFIPFARYSQNPIISKKGRVSYPEKEGCIGKAWEYETCCENNMSLSKLNQYNIPRDTYDQLKMKAKTIYAHRIGSKRKSIGVLVLESKTKNYATREIKEKISQEIESLNDFISLIYDDIPTPQIAEENGL